MLLAQQVNKYSALDEWFQTPQGRRVAQAFANELVQLSEGLKGGNVLQLGSCGENLWLPELKYRRKFLVSPCVVSQKTALLSSLTMLPIERDSIDCILAPLTLEAFSGSRNPLDEIDRVLKPMGYAIFFGVNPFSFWGAALRWRHLSCFGLTSTQLTSSFSLRRMMLQRGYRQCALTSFYYILPVSSEALITKLEFFNEMGKMIWPFPSAFYCFIVQKYQPASPSLLHELVVDELNAPKIPIPAAS